MFFTKFSKLKAFLRDAGVGMSGGAYKRIDENRELLELLQTDAPEFLASHPWVEGWISAHDKFFVALAAAVPPDRHTPYPGFPRAWPGRTYK